MLSRLFQYRFAGGEGLSGHSFGNLLLTALTGITGDFYQAILTAESILSVRGRILPATLTDVRLIAHGRSGETYRGESAIGTSGEPIEELVMEPAAAFAFPAAVKAIETADLIALGPGSLYTSIVPNLLIPGIRRAVRATRGRVVLLQNLMTQPGETDDMDAAAHFAAVSGYLGPDAIDSVLVHEAEMPAERLEAYAEQGARPVLSGDHHCFGTAEVVRRDLLDEGDLIRHDPAKLALAALEQVGIGARMAQREMAAVVLAAGKGTRMRSARPKVLHEVAGRPMLAWVLAAARAAGCGKLIVVVGHGAGEVRAAVAASDVRFVVQEEQLGTGHALAQAAPHLSQPTTILVLSGDVPLVRATTLRRLAAASTKAWGALAVADLAEPGSLGRVIARHGGKELDRIVEAADARLEELAIRTVNSGLYALPSPEVFEALAGLEPDNAKGELYLTDALGVAAAAGEKVALVELDDPAEALGANDRRDLARIHREFINRKLEEAGPGRCHGARPIRHSGRATSRGRRRHRSSTRAWR